MKAIIPVAGAGTQLRPHTYTQPKALIPVAGKPILGFIIEQLQSAGFTDFIFVIGYLGEKIKTYVAEKHPGIHAQYVVQQNRLGLGHAIWTTRALVQENEEIFIVLGDTIVEADLAPVQQLPGSALGLKKVEDPRNFGVAEIDENNFIQKVEEKPLIPTTNYALVGLYKIRETGLLFHTLEQMVQNRKNEGSEIHLTDAIQNMIEQGVSFQGFKVQNWYDCGKRDILLQTNATLLKKRSKAPDALHWFENTIIIHPVEIAGGTKISNSIIGPFVTIGENSVIDYSILKNSIIGDFANLKSVILHNSVIGSDASITGHSQSLNIGDNTEIDLSGKN